MAIQQTTANAAAHKKDSGINKKGVPQYRDVKITARAYPIKDSPVKLQLISFPHIATTDWFVHNNPLGYNKKDIEGMIELYKALMKDL
ncbi:MAG: hypothetical protein V4506_15250 [Bacteroidota bacterium]